MALSKFAPRIEGETPRQPRHPAGHVWVEEAATSAPPYETEHEPWKTAGKWPGGVTSDAGVSLFTKDKITSGIAIGRDSALHAL